MSAPPPRKVCPTDIASISDTNSTPTIVNRVRILHKDIYTTGHELSKRDKLGIHKLNEDLAVKLLALLIEAAFTRREQKLKTLELARVQAEVLKNLIRTEHELKIISEDKYIQLSKEIVEISRMLSKWISYIASLKTSS